MWCCLQVTLCDPYLSALEALACRHAIQIHVYLLYYVYKSSTDCNKTFSQVFSKVVSRKCAKLSVELLPACRDQCCYFVLRSLCLYNTTLKWPNYQPESSEILHTMFTKKKQLYCCAACDSAYLKYFLSAACSVLANTV